MQAALVLVYCCIIVIAAFCGSGQDAGKNIASGFGKLFAVRDPENHSLSQSPMNRRSPDPRSDGPNGC